MQRKIKTTADSTFEKSNQSKGLLNCIGFNELHIGQGIQEWTK